MNTQRIFEKIEERKEELFQLLSSLVQIDSQNFSTHGNEKEIAQYIHKLCQDMGLESAMYSPMELPGFADHPDYIPGHNLEDRYNVTAVYKGKQDKNTLMLMAHSDTVQFGDLKNWDLPPTSGAIKDGRIYGRGVGDDKSGIAVMLFLAKLLKEEGFEPKENLLLNAYCDEEYGGSHGALAAVLRDKCERIVNMDMIEDTLIHCGTGGGELKYRFHSVKPADSSRPVARAMSTVMDVLDIFAENRRRELEANRFYAGTDIPASSMRYIGVQAGHNGNDLGVGEIHFVFYTDKTKAEIDPELAELDKMLQQRLEPLGMVSDGFEPTTRFFHYVFCEPDSPHILDYQEAAMEATGKSVRVEGGCLSDQSVIAKYGTMEAFSTGVIRDFTKEGGAHQPNECVECDKLVEYTKTIAAYILKVLQ
ncbi:MAG: M20 family metallopeptidase [Oscillospiraceae bacterium]|nr:M20 family metallopeptidase [Oscillospiraceae bacterium]